MANVLRRWINGKIVRNAGKLGAHIDCCCFIYSISICNDNKVMDDNFDIKINGTKIGTHSTPNAPNDPPTCSIGTIADSSFFATESGVTNNDPNADCRSGASAEQVFSRSLIVTGLNTLLMENTQNNSCNNLGKILMWELDTSFTIVRTLINDTYSGASGLNFSFPFTV